MSDTQPDQGEGGMPFTSVTGAGDFVAFDLADQFAPLLSVSDDYDLGAYFTHWLEALAPSLSQTELDTLGAITDTIGSVTSHGLLYPSQLYGFFRWIWATQGVSTVSAAMVASGQLLIMLITYADSLGQIVSGVSTVPALPTPAPPTLASAPPAASGPWEPWVPPDLAALFPPAPAATVPWEPWSPPDFAAIFPPGPAEVTFPDAPPPADPTTPGGHVVKTALAGTTPTTVTMAGVDAEVAKAVSAAMQAETAALTKLVAQSVDQALGGLQPGQAKSQMQGTANSVSALKRAVAALQTAVATDNTAAIKADLAKVNTEVAKLISQLDLTEPSALDTHVNSIGDQANLTEANLAKTELAVIGIDTTLNLMPTPAELTATGAAVTKLISQMDLSEPSALDSHLNAVDATAQDALRVAEDAEACCEAQTGNLSNLQKDLGGASGLANLAKLAGLAFGLTFLAGIVDAVVAIFDLPAAVLGTVADVETLSGWADACATQAIADSGWSATMAA